MVSVFTIQTFQQLNGLLQCSKAQKHMVLYELHVNQQYQIESVLGSTGDTYIKSDFVTFTISGSTWYRSTGTLDNTVHDIWGLDKIM